MLSSCAEVLECSSSAMIGWDVDLFVPSKVVAVALVISMATDVQLDDVNYGRCSYTHEEGAKVSVISFPLRLIW